jgi:uroporphyrinogen-III synthase
MERSYLFLDQLIQAGVEENMIQIAPVLEIVPVDAPIEIAAHEAVIFSSIAGVDVAAKKLGRAELKAYCVGEKTAAAARHLGYEVCTVAPDVERLFQQMSARPVEAVVHIRGEHTRGNLVSKLRGLGWSAREQVVYQQKEVPFATKVFDIIQRENPLVLPLFSPRSARLLVDRLPKRGDIYGIAMSEAVRQVVNDFEWSRLDVANAPDAASMVSQTLHVLKGLRI